MDYFDILLAKKLNGGGGGDIDLQTLNVTENGTVNAPSGVAYNKVITNVPAPSNAIYKQTLSGLPSPIATFTGADAPLDSLKASIVGVQDLHGYDSPWPAGGGKNKFQVTANSVTDNGVTFTVNSDGTVATSGTASANVTFNLNTFDFKAGESYILNGCPTGGSLNSYLLSINGVGYDSGSGYTYSPQSDITKTVRIVVYSGTNMNGKVFKPMIRLATETDPTFAPYENICPISGWTACEVSVTDDLTNPTYTDTYTIPFKDGSDNPITLVDGNIDITGGGWSSGYGFKTISTAWLQASNGVFYLDNALTDGLASAVGEDANIECNLYPSGVGVNNTAGALSNPKQLCVQNLNGIRILVYDDSFADLTAFNTFIANNPIQIKYPLATPISNTFTPIALRSDGLTNISVNCGEVTECKYFSETP